MEWCSYSGWVSHLSKPNPENPSQVCPESRLLGDSRSCHVVNKLAAANPHTDLASKKTFLGSWPGHSAMFVCVSSSEKPIHSILCICCVLCQSKDLLEEAETSVELYLKLCGYHDFSANQDLKDVVIDHFLCHLCVSKVPWNDILEIQDEILVIDRDGRLGHHNWVFSVFWAMSSISGTWPWTWQVPRI